MNTIKHVLLTALLIVVILVPGFAQNGASREAEFKQFYANFLSASRANDKDKIADMIAFPVDSWSVDRKGDVRTEAIKDKAQFLSKYTTYFTANMRVHIPKAKLKALDDGGYFISWRDANSEFSFDFAYVEGSGYRIRYFSIGPW
ncbi:MAG TPA: hypothetical protein VKN18_28300 [Blastocatellia bacterium]|nr:hypothetical protein [Blastocatellia bacterium]